MENDIFDEYKEVQKRQNICKECPYNSVLARTSEEYKELYGGNYTPVDRNDFHCTHCLCNIAFKTSKLSEKCGLSFYNELNPFNQQELKWDSYEPI